MHSAVLPINLRSTVATSKRCMGCERERVAQCLPAGPQTAAILDYLESKGGDPIDPNM
jgi:hypothetical protein